MSQITRLTYAVEVIDPDAPSGTVEHTVRIVHGDRMRAELEGPKHGLNDVRKQAFNYTTLWVWCALVRLKLYSGSYREFVDQDLVDLAPLDKVVGGQIVGTTVDPTRADTSASPSSSPSTSVEAPATGSTPTSTTS